MRRTAAYTQTTSQRLVEGMTRDEVCLKFRNKVHLIARRISDRLSNEARVTLDDLVSSGALGLLEAFDRYDAERGIQFTTYAEYRIKGAIYDDLRKGDAFSRRRRQLQKTLDHAVSQLRTANGREPEPSEVASSLDMSLEEYWTARDKVKPVNHVSLDSTDDDEDGRPLIESLICESEDAPDLALRIADVRRHLREAIASLPERQRQCVLMYYGKEMSLAEIAAVYDVTVSRISQILSDSRKKMRKRLEPVVDRADLQLGMTV
jgi:RNA polymerase sigma factor for flagellar operon FliA